MKVLFSFFLLALGVFPIFATDPGEWFILHPEYVYSGGSSIANSPLKNKKVTDIAISSDGKLWVACENDLFTISGTDKLPKAVHDLQVGQVPFKDSRIPPVIQPWKDNIGLLLSNGFWEGQKSGKWNILGTAVNKSAVQRSEMTNFVDFLYTPEQLYISGYFTEKDVYRQGLGIVNSQEGNSTIFMSDDITKSAVVFRNMVKDKNGIIWMRGNADGNGLWRLFQGKVEPVKGIQVFNITTDLEGNAVIATPVSILKISANNETEVILNKGASYVFFDRNNILWYAPAGGKPEEEEKTVKLKDLKWSDMKVSHSGGTPAEAVPVLVRYDLSTGRSYPLTTDNSPIRGSIGKIVADAGNTKYILAGSGIYAINDSKPVFDNWNILSHVFDGDIFTENFWSTGYNDGKGNFYGFGKQSGGYQVIQYSNGRKTAEYTVDTKIELGDVVVSGDKAYAGSDNFLYEVGAKGELKEVSGMDKKQMDNRVSAITADGKGNVWVGSKKCLAMYDGKGFTYFNKKNSSLPNNAVLSLSSDGKRVFAGTTDGLAVYENGNWTTFNKKNGLSSDKVYAVASNDKGQTFIGSVNAFMITNTMDIYENGAIRQETIPEKIRIEQMIFDAKGNLWIRGADDLVCRKVNGEYVVYHHENSPLKSPFMCLDMFVFGDEIRITTQLGVSERVSQSDNSSMPDKKTLYTFDPMQKVLILKNDL